MNGSNGKIEGLLLRIADGQERTNEKLDGVIGEVQQLTGEVQQLTGHVRHLTGQVQQLTGEVQQTNKRLDNVVMFMGSHHADHEQRLQALEHVVFKKSG